MLYTGLSYPFMAVHFQAAEACFHTVSTERWGSHLCIIEWWFLRLREQGREWRLGLSWFALDLLGPSRPREAKKQCFRGLWPLPAVKMFTKPYGQGFRRLTPAPLQFVGYMGATRHFVVSHVSVEARATEASAPKEEVGLAVGRAEGGPCKREGFVVIAEMATKNLRRRAEQVVVRARLGGHGTCQRHLGAQWPPWRPVPHGWQHERDALLGWPL